MLSWFEGSASGSTFGLDFMKFFIVFSWFKGSPSGSAFRLNFMMLSSSLCLQSSFADMPGVADHENSTQGSLREI